MGAVLGPTLELIVSRVGWYTAKNLVCCCFFISNAYLIYKNLTSMLLSWFCGHTHFSFERKPRKLRKIVDGSKFYRNKRFSKDSLEAQFLKLCFLQHVIVSICFLVCWSIISPDRENIHYNIKNYQFYLSLFWILTLEFRSSIEILIKAHPYYLNFNLIQKHFFNWTLNKLVLNAIQFGIIIYSLDPT